MNKKVLWAKDLEEFHLRQGVERTRQQSQQSTPRTNPPRSQHDSASQISLQMLRQMAAQAAQQQQLTQAQQLVRELFVLGAYSILNRNQNQILQAQRSMRHSQSAQRPSSSTDTPKSANHLSPSVTPQSARCVSSSDDTPVYQTNVQQGEGLVLPKTDQSEDTIPNSPVFCESTPTAYLPRSLQQNNIYASPILSPKKTDISQHVTPTARFTPKKSFHSPAASTSDGRIQRGRKRSHDIPDKLSEPGNKMSPSGTSRHVSPAGSSGNQAPHSPSGQKYDQMTSFIIEFTERRKQDDECLKKKKVLREAIFRHIKPVFPYSGLYIVGSSMNGFGSNLSDMDMCLMISPNQVDQKREAINVLRVLFRELRKCSFLRKLQLIRAKVPILKFEDSVSGIECDLNINNEVGIRNTHLLHAYCNYDSRIQPLVLFVKYWAKYHNINDASQGTISSYSLALMVLHYLQCGCQPPVVPSLQKQCQEMFTNDRDIRQLGPNPPVLSKSANQQSVGELFTGFLNYYSNHFNFESEGMSVRLGEKVSKETLMLGNRWATAEGQWKFLCIEEPFNLSNTARSVYDEYTFMRICRVFRVSNQKLQKTADIEALISFPI